MRLFFESFLSTLKVSRFGGQFHFKVDELAIEHDEKEEMPRRNVETEFEELAR